MPRALSDFPLEGTDLSVYFAEHLAAVTQRLNTRPRKGLGWRTPAQILAAQLTPDDRGVATTSRRFDLAISA